MSVPTITNIGRTSSRFNWSTNIPATSQVEILDVLSGVTTLSPLSPELKTSRTVDLNGLSANRLYRVTTISSSSGVKAPIRNLASFMGDIRSRASSSGRAVVSFAISC